MAYCTLVDLEKTLPDDTLRQLADDKATSLTYQQVVDEAIAQADGEIDTYLGGRYSVPLATVPAIIRRCSCDITSYLLYKRRVEKISDARRGAYKGVLRILEQIRDGKMDLPELTASGALAFSTLISSHFGDD